MAKRPPAHAVILVDTENNEISPSSPPVVDVTLVLDTNAYAPGDVLVVPQEVTGFFPFAGGTRTVHSIIVLDEDDQAQALDLIFFNASASLGTINSAVSISDADARKIIGAVKVETSDYIDLANSQVAVKSSVGETLNAASGTTSVWIGAVSRGTGAYTASGIKLKIGFI